MGASRWLCAGVFSLSTLLGVRAVAQEIDCTSDLGDVEVDGNLNIAVPCQLDGTDVLGNVTLFSGGSLTARDTYISGNVEGKRGDFVDIVDSGIDGDIKLEEFVGDLSIIQDSSIGGDVTLKKNRSRFEILNNDFDRSLHATDGTGGLVISGNSFGRNLQCDNNDPAPTGLGNRVDGRATGQCENLAPWTWPWPTTPPTPEPPPATDTPPPATPSTPPPATGNPPPATPSTPASTPPPVASTPPPATPSTPEPTAERVDRGGLGAFDSSAALLLLPLLLWRRFARGRPVREPAT